jgi:hypothetical protein
MSEEKLKIQGMDLYNEKYAKSKIAAAVKDQLKMEGAEAQTFDLSFDLLWGGKKRDESGKLG